MIADLAREVTALLEERAELQKQQKTAQAVAKTAESIAAAVGVAQAHRTRVEVLAPHVAPSTRETAAAETGRVLAEVKASHGDFAAQRNQAAALERAAASLNESLGRLQQGWVTAATTRVGEFASPLALVRGIVTEQQRGHLIDLQGRLQQLASSPPATRTKANEYLQACKELRTALDAVVSKLTPSVRTFLEKVGSGEATLADLSDEVLAWCRNEEHGSRFTIRYRQ